MEESMLDETKRYIDALSDLEQEMLSISEKIADYKQRADTIKIEITADVLNATNSKGAVLYSNAEKRELETQTRLNENRHFMDYSDAMKDLQHSMRKKRVEADILAWRIKTNLAFATHIAS